jgi:hypothetical protein
MPTPQKGWRATPDDERRIAMIKHLTGYATDAKAIREALKCKLEQLQKGSE